MIGSSGRRQAEGLKAGDLHNRREKAMAEQESEKKKVQTTKHRRPLRWWAGVVMLAAAVLLALLWFSELLTRRSAEQQLAAIEAARAIPDEQNAALIYTELAATTDLASNQPRFLASEARTEPWLSADHPEAAQLVKNHQVTIRALQETRTKEQCRFSISNDPTAQSHRSQLVRKMNFWGLLLILGANNDVGEGIQMAKHLYQQPTMNCWKAALGKESLALANLSRLIVAGTLKETDLARIEDLLPATADKWAENWPTIRTVEELYEQDRPEEFSFLHRLLSRFARAKRVDQERLRQEEYEAFHDAYLRQLARRRGVYILIALRRYKDAHGSWPETLEDASELAPAETFIDPQNDSGFIYEADGRDITLYSRGRNNIDEGGQIKGAISQLATRWPRLAQSQRPEQ
ncbi:MAG: hypothetical protein ACYSUP_13805 [Planctomycetota bacterium]